MNEIATLNFGQLNKCNNKKPLFIKDKSLNDILDKCSIIHQNVQSLGNSIDSVNNMLENNSSCKLLCITEHWKSPEELKMLAIKNFNMVNAFCRGHGEHGGSAIYVHKSVKCKPRNKLNQLSIKNSFECAAVECTFGKDQLLVMSVYRPPLGSIDIFFNCLEKVLLDVFVENKKIVMTGDFNIEMIKNNENKTNLLSLMSSFNIVSTVFENTRITSRTASCIDNIFVNCEYVNTLVLNTFISDHTAQKLVLSLQRPHHHTSQFKRFFSEENKQNFIHCLKEQNWREVFETDNTDVNKQWNCFINLFCRLF